MTTHTHNTDLLARLNHIEQTNTRITAEITDVRQENAQIKAQFTNARRRFRVQSGLALVALAGAVFLAPGNRAAMAQSGNDFMTRLAALEAKTQYVSVDQTGDMHITGTNLHIENGTGQTETANGKGNLTIGYNYTRDNGQDNRSGSHYLILGDWNNYTCHGGIVGGEYNQADGVSASVLGGSSNRSGGYCSVVVTGYSNNAGYDYSAVVAGDSNYTGGSESAILGGHSNASYGYLDCISGGEYNWTNGTAASISGGYSNYAGLQNWGGWSYYNRNGRCASVTGGYANYSTGDYASVSGGVANQSAEIYTSIVGGLHNSTQGWYSTILGGYNNGTGTGAYSATIVGGHDLWMNAPGTWMAGPK